MPEWAAGAIVAVVLATGGGILHYLFEIKTSLATLVANQRHNEDDIDELKSWRLNQEHARALGLLPEQRRRR